MKTTGLHAAGKGINVAKVLKDTGIDVTVGGFRVKTIRMVFSNCSASWALPTVSGCTGRTRINVKLTEKTAK